MVDKRSSLALVGVATILLGGCSFSSDSLWPMLSGESPSGERASASAASAAPGKVEIKPSASERSAQATMSSAPLGAQPPKLGSTNFSVQPPQPGKATGTFVGNKVVQLRDDLARLQSSITQHNGNLQTVRKTTRTNATAYHARVAGIRSRLQVGTTPGNPALVNEWNQAQLQLEAINNDIGQMNALANRVAADAAMSAYLLESTRAAFGLSGAVDEDHRQLAILEDDVNRTVVLIDRLLTELSDDIRRQSTYVGNERGDLNTLALAIKNGEFFGSSLASRSYGATAVGGSDRTGLSGNRSSVGSLAGRRPLVVIRFDRPNVNYQQALYTAVSRALERRPNASFDLIAVTPLKGSTAKVAIDSSKARRNAQAVLRALTDMGLPPSRVALSATTSADASGNEVRLFVR
ncbi:MAG: hypothetical protein HOL85_08960 [Rhodospirillaceae bacterium]|nr:hypothetical protein [Rhodospirillaceae bacterium]MBT6139722.1 hypothetical protein [Rhodospirillaceae bacterium]